MKADRDEDEMIVSKLVVEKRKPVRTVRIKVLKDAPKKPPVFELSRLVVEAQKPRVVELIRLVVDNEEGK